MSREKFIGKNVREGKMKGVREKQLIHKSCRSTRKTVIYHNIYQHCDIVDDEVYLQLFPRKPSNKLKLFR